MLDGKKIGDVAIQLSSIKLTSQEVVDALYQLDEMILTEDLIHKLLILSPNPDEEALLRENAGRIDKLTQQEQFLFSLIEVPSIKALLEMILFRMQFDSKYLSYDANLQCL